MAKRARGTTTRPGQRRPIQRPAARSSSTSARPTSTAPGAELTTPRSASLTPEEEARAARLEAAIVAEERHAEVNRRSRTQPATPEPVVRSSSPLAVAANEYAYVARDVRRVAMVGGSLIGLLVALWVVTQVTGVTL